MLVQASLGDFTALPPEVGKMASLEALVVLSLLCVQFLLLCH